MIDIRVVVGAMTRGNQKDSHYLNKHKYNTTYDYGYNLGLLSV